MGFEKSKIQTYDQAPTSSRVDLYRSIAGHLLAACHAGSRWAQLKCLSNGIESETGKPLALGA